MDNPRGLTELVYINITESLEKRRWFAENHGHGYGSCEGFGKGIGICVIQRYLKKNLICCPHKVGKGRFHRNMGTQPPSLGETKTINNLMRCHHHDHK